MIRICPKRDAVCPHGTLCPYAVDKYTCEPENYREPGEFGEGATVRRAEPAAVLDKDAEIERLQTENASLRHSSLVARLSHEQLNRFIRLFDGAGFKGHQVDVQAKMAVEEIERLRAEIAQMKADHACEIADMATRFRAVNVERLSESLGADVFAMREKMDALEAVLRKIAAYDDAAANAYLRATGEYSAFDEPDAVQMARGVLEGGS